MNKLTSRAIEVENESKPKTVSNAERLYAARDSDVAMLVKKGVITLQDVQGLCRIGRFKIADEHFDICDIDARKALRFDEHHFVRAAVEWGIQSKPSIYTFS